MTRNIYLLAALLSFAPVAFAQEDAFVLPQSIFRARAVGVLTQGIDNSYDNQGQRGTLLYPLNSTLTATDLAARSAAAGDPSLQTLIEGLNAIQPGMGDNLLSVQMRAQGQLNIQQFVAALEYGLTPSLSLGLRVPVVRVSASGVNFNTTVNSNAQAIINSGAAAGYESQLGGIDAQVAASVNPNSIFTAKGYKIPSDFNATGLGDVEMGTKIQYFNNNLVQAVVQIGLRLPTATHKADISNILDRSSGDGQTDLGVRLTQQIEPIDGLLLGSSAHFIYQFPDTETLAVNALGESGLPDLTNPSRIETVDRYLGVSLETEVSASYSFYRKSFRPYLAYQFNAHAQDGYVGSRGLDYASLERNTANYAHRMELGLGYSTIQLFKDKDFFVPLEAKLSYNFALGAKNSPDVSYFRTDLIVYF